MTSTTITPGRPLPGWLKTGLLAALVFALCWGGAIAWWQSANSEPGAGDLLLMLLALPCGLLLVFKLGKKFVLPRPAAPAAAAAIQPAPGGASPAASTPPLAILAAALRSPHGASAEELAAAIAEGKARADLDPELVDDDGFPITSARSMDAVDEALQEEVSDWLELNGMAAPGFSDAQWRALILGTLVARDLAAHAVSELIPADGAAPRMQLIPVLPTGWTDEQRHAVGMWFRHAVAQFGWPAANIVPVDLPAAPGRTPGSAILGLVNQFALDSRAGDWRLAALVIACDSHIGQETVDQWAANASLFTPTRPQGLIPGEGAAGLLLTSLHGARLIDGAVFAQLHPMLEARRDASLDEVRRADTKLIAELSERVARAAGLELSEVAAIAADTDHRAKRGLELMGLASSALPQLDGTLDVARVGVALGACGAVPFVTVLALARHHALDSNAPALFISNEDPLACCAALVCPPTVAPAPARTA
ncbi:MAG: hypothetical protein JWQ80_37 [Massilia sp.]|nr:hypothetical protein [Massilia sp.]